jgi:fructoselysine-6-P-deglycase FrlB-like protein
MIARRFPLSTVFLLLLTLLLTACGGDEPQPVAVEPAPPPPHPWDVFIEDQIEAHLEAHPAWAVTQGRHEFDGQLPDWSEAGLQAEVQRLRQARRDAMAFVDADLSPEQQFQRDYFVSRIDHDLFWRVKARWPFRNPEFYFGWLSDSLDPAPYITLDYAPVEERMAAFTRYLEALPEAARQIRSNLRMPMPETWLQLGIDSFSGYASYFRDEVPAVWAEVDDEALQARFRAANEQAIASMTELAEWLELGRSIADQSFALGPALYEEMLWDTERVRIDLKELEEAARADMQRNLAALRNAEDGEFVGSLVIANVDNSSLVRESDLVFLTRAGPEIGVASTKAFTTQLVALMMLVIVLGRRRGMSEERQRDLTSALHGLPDFVQQTLELESEIETLSEAFIPKRHALFLGRGIQYPIAMEGALKLKEISYIHAEAYPAGELKHGPLALVDDDMPVVAVAPSDDLLEKLKSNLEEVRSRGGELFVFADRQAGFVSEPRVSVLPMPHCPEVIKPIVYTVALQLLSYYVAVQKGTDVDKPRNLAKSVTVE